MKPTPSGPVAPAAFALPGGTVSAQGNAGPDDGRGGQLRWLIRAGVAAIALYLIADGLIGIWPDAGPTARVVIVVAVVLGLVAAGVGALYVVRRDRSE
jgi:hypothetical protein